MGLSVGRSMSTVSTSGTSTPSLNRSTENTTRTRPCGQIPQRGLTLGPRAVAPDGDGGDAMAGEVLGHEPGVLDADAEPEAPHRRRVGVLGDLLDDEPGPGVGAGVGVAERLDVVAASSPPRDLAQVEAVVDAEVEER